MGFEDMVPDPAGRDEPQPQTWDAVIASDAADLTDPVYVTIPGWDDGKHRHGPCPWVPRIASATEYGIPERGDLALVTTSNEGEVRILVWWPDGS